MKWAVPLLLLGGLALGELSWASRAQACQRPLPAEFSLDPALVGRDLEAPPAPRAVTALASRNSGLFCAGDRCTSSSCGSEAYLQLEFASALDASSAPGELGYRLHLREGSVPPELEAPLKRIFGGVSPLRVSVPEAFDAVVALDATFELVAIDRAGNESAGSEPFRIAFDACTRVVGQGGCAEDNSPPVTCTAAAGCIQAASESGELDAGGCSLAAFPPAFPPSFPRAGRALSLLCVGLVGGAWQLRRRPRADLGRVPRKL